MPQQRMIVAILFRMRIESSQFHGVLDRGEHDVQHVLRGGLGRVGGMPFERIRVNCCLTGSETQVHDPPPVDLHVGGTVTHAQHVRRRAD